MSSQLLSSKIVVNEEEPRIRNVQGLPTSILAAVGITERGPVREPVLVTSFEEYVNTFGGDTVNSDLTHAMRGFFENGGNTAYVSRVVHYTDINTPATKTSAKGSVGLLSAATAPSSAELTGSVVGPFILSSGDTLVVDVDGNGDLTATFTAEAAALTAGNTETYALSDGENLTLSVDGGVVQDVAFLTAEFADIANATALEVAAVINAKATGLQASVAGGAVVLTSDTLGTSSSVEVTGGTANGALGFSTTLVAGTGNVADVSAVTVAEVKAVVEAAVAGLTVNNVAGAVQLVSNTTGASSSIAVNASSTADDELGLGNATVSGGTGAAVTTLTVEGKYDGAYAADIKALVTEATNGVSSNFNLSVEDGGVVVEVFPNLSMDPTADNYALPVVNGDTGSNLIALVDPGQGLRPTNVTSTALAGGDDGLTGLDDNDFIGSDAGKTGFRAFDTIQDLNLLIAPGQATAAVHAAMVNYADVLRDKSMFAILDCPAGLDVTGINDYVLNTASLLGLSEHAAIYWPQVKVLNPSSEIFGNDATIVVPPSGHIAGVYARTDNRRVGGVYDSPAGVERGILAGVLGFETDEVLEEAKRDLIYPNRINPLTTLPGQPRFIDGGRTLKGNGNFPNVSERRGVIFIEQSIKRALEFARHSNNDARLRATIARTVVNFLLAQLRVNAFRSSVPTEAFFVDASEALNPPSVVFSGQLIVRIGLATQKPAEFIILRFSQDTRALEAELAAAGA